MYFSNGTEGEMFRDKYCFNCQLFKFFDLVKLEECPVWELHEDMNYEAVGKNKDKTAERALETFIPRKTGKCKIFEAIARGKFHHDW